MRTDWMCSVYFFLFCYFIFFFFNDTATTEIYTLSLHDALPIYRATGDDSTIPPAPVRPGIQPLPQYSRHGAAYEEARSRCPARFEMPSSGSCRDRKSTRLNSSHALISYAVFCLKKKNNTNKHIQIGRAHI